MKNKTAIAGQSTQNTKAIIAESTVSRYNLWKLKTTKEPKFQFVPIRKSNEMSGILNAREYRWLNAEALRNYLFR